MTRRIGSGTLVIATNNAGKLKEISALLEPYGIECLSAGSLGLPEPAETGKTFAENALIKAQAAASASGLPALADDSGLSVDEYNGIESSMASITHDKSAFETSRACIEQLDGEDKDYLEKQVRNLSMMVELVNLSVPSSP